MQGILKALAAVENKSVRDRFPGFLNSAAYQIPAFSSLFLFFTDKFTQPLHLLPGWREVADREVDAA